MNNKEFLEQASKTENFEAYEKLSGLGLSNKTFRLLHAAIGISTEAGELLDIFKKKIYYDKDIDKVNLHEELGDILWYIAIICNSQKISLEELMDINVKKLKARYGEIFKKDDALNRNLDHETNIMEEGLKFWRNQE